MDFKEYQLQARTTAIYPESGTGTYAALSYAVLGLTNEAGEVAGKLKKIYRDNAGQITKYSREALADELSDVLWYLSAVAVELNVDLDSVAEHNLDKLNSRKERGVLGGSGDNR